MTDRPAPAGLWPLEPGIAFLNHGSFGACPVEVLHHQAALRAEMEAQPVRFLARELEGRLDAARRALAAFVGADPDGLAFVPNATTGVNAVLRSLPLAPGDELLVTDHAYNACRNALDDTARRTGARVVVTRVPFPLAAADEAVEAIVAGATARTRLALIDHVTSPTALVLPVARLVAELGARGVDVLVDGAHAPGMVPLDVGGLGAAYYTGNCHKWLCAPKGSAFLWVRGDRRGGVRPVTISHGANAARADRSRFHLEFDWTGTGDPTPWLAVPRAIEYLGGLVDGGWPALMARNRALALEARGLLCDVLATPPPCPDAMIGSIASIPLPDGPAATDRAEWDGLQRRLWEGWAIEVPVMRWPAPPRRLLRVSAQLYNAPADYARLAEALGRALAAERSAA